MMIKRPAAIAILLSTLALGCGMSDDPASLETALTSASLHDDDGHDQNPNPALFPRDARPFGRSMETWAERWWGWLMGVPFDVNPNLNLTADCDVHQDGPIFFLAHVLVGPSTTGRTCTVPRDKPIAVTVATVLNDYPCPDPTFQPAPGQSLFDFLIGPAKEGQDHVANIELTLDGEPIKDVLSYRVASDDLFFFTGDPSMQAFDSCVTGTPQPAVVDSFFIVLKPLDPGTHELTTTTTSIFGTVFGPRTMTLEVADEDEQDRD